MATLWHTSGGKLLVSGGKIMINTILDPSFGLRHCYCCFCPVEGGLGAGIGPDGYAALLPKFITATVAGVTKSDCVDSFPDFVGPNSGCTCGGSSSCGIALHTYNPVSPNGVYTPPLVSASSWQTQISSLPVVRLTDKCCGTSLGVGGSIAGLVLSIGYNATTQKLIGLITYDTFWDQDIGGDDAPRGFEEQYAILFYGETSWTAPAMDPDDSIVIANSVSIGQTLEGDTTDVVNFHGADVWCMGGGGTITIKCTLS